MNKLFDKIYNLTYTPLVTPFNLLNNLKLDNYHEINFHKRNGEIVAQIKCTIDNKMSTFEYIFNSDNFLMKITHIDKSGNEILFDRNSELSTDRDDYLKQLSINKNII